MIKLNSGPLVPKHHSSIKVIVLDEDCIEASVDRGEVINQSFVFFSRIGEAVLALQG